MRANPKPCTFIVTAFDDKAAGSLIRESLRLDYAGESDPAILATHVRLKAMTSGQAVLEAKLADLLQGGGGKG